MKRVLSLFLIIALCLSCTVFAADFKDTEKHQNREAIDIVNTLSVIEGYPSGMFGPNDTLTRAEAATMITRAVLQDRLVGYSNFGFDDVPYSHWARNYISTAYAYGIVNGYGNNKFGPEDRVTNIQFATMVLNALGYKALNLSWPQGVADCALALGIFNGVQMISLSDYCTRANAAQMIYNALPLNMVSSRNGVVYSTKTTLLDVLGYEEVQPTLVEDGEHIGEFLRTFKKDKKAYISNTYASEANTGIITTKGQVKVDNKVYDVDWTKVYVFVNGTLVKNGNINIAADEKVKVVTLYSERDKKDIVCSIVYTKATTYIPGEVLPTDVARAMKKDKDFNPYTSTVTYINADNYYISNKYVFNRVIDTYTARGIHYVILADDTVYNYEGFVGIQNGDWIMIYFDYENEIAGFQIFTEYQEPAPVVD